MPQSTVGWDDACTQGVPSLKHSVNRWFDQGSGHLFLRVFLMNPERSHLRVEAVKNVGVTVAIYGSLRARATGVTEEGRGRGRRQ